MLKFHLTFVKVKYMYVTWHGSMQNNLKMDDSLLDLLEEKSYGTCIRTDIWQMF